MECILQSYTTIPTGVISMDPMERISKVEILKAIDAPNEPFVSDRIRKCELAFGYDGPLIDVDFIELTNSRDWSVLMKQKDYPNWKMNKDSEWSARYNIKTIGLMFAASMNKVSKATEKTVKNAVMAMKYTMNPILVQKISAVTSWITTGYMAYEVWPLGENPYAPLLELLENGYIARRINGRWLVGWVKTKETASDVLASLPQT